MFKPWEEITLNEFHSALYRMAFFKDFSNKSYGLSKLYHT
jgi:hypothetical protein